MKPLTREWVDKAEADFASARREYRARKSPNYDAACFLAQQCIEKYLKARLQEASIRFGKTHDLEALLNQLATIEPMWTTLSSILKPLSAYAVVFRYPGRSATKTEAKEAIGHAAQVRSIARSILGLPIVPRIARRSKASKGKTARQHRKRRR